MPLLNGGEQCGDATGGPSRERLFRLANLPKSLRY